MKKEEIYKKIDRELEKQVYLFNANEGNCGLYELLSELGRYNFLSIVDKYFVAYDLLFEILKEELVILEEYKDDSLQEKIRDIPFNEVEKIMNDPWSWYPSNKPLHTIEITKKGIEHVNQLDKEEKIKLNLRLFPD